MNKKLKVLASAMTVLMVASTLVGCGSSSSSDSAKGGQTLTIWSEYKGADLVPIKKVTDAWAKKTGNKVVLKESTGFDALQSAVKSSKGPDIDMGLPQDRLGQYVNAGAVAEVPSSAYSSSDYLAAAAGSVKYKGKNWAIPNILKTYALFYNKDMVSTPPTTWDDMVAQGKKVGLKWDPTDFYFNYALISANGGYVYKVKNGTPDTSSNGLGGDGAVKGFTMLKQLVDDKIISASDTGDISKGLFTSKKVGMFISGTWAIGDMKKAGINFGVVKYPQINGKDVPTFASIDLNLVTSSSKNKDLAFQFLKDNAESLQKELFEQQYSIPTLKKLAESKDVTGNEITKAFLDQVKVAEVMGNYPEFGQIWAPGANHLKSLAAGKETPEQAAKGLSADVQQGVAALK